MLLLDMWGWTGALTVAAIAVPIPLISLFWVIMFWVGSVWPMAMSAVWQAQTQQCKADEQRKRVHELMQDCQEVLNTGTAAGGRVAGEAAAGGVD